MTEPIPGLYDQLITPALEPVLTRPGLHAEHRPLDPAEAPQVLARHLHDALQRSLRALPGHGHELLQNQVALTNHILETLATRTPHAVTPHDAVTLRGTHPEQLLALVPIPALGDPQPPRRPGIPLSASALLINARDEHRIGHEILQELDSADRVDLLCSFLKFSGWRLIRDAVKQRAIPIRVLTTCYLGATDQRVLDELSALDHVQLRVSYDTRRTRLHAKAWLFHRDTGFSTAYIGSSNLSSAAMLDGLEWNVRLSRVDTPAVLEKFSNTYESYWNDAAFEPYDRERFEAATRAERRHEHVIFPLDVHPFPHQQEILDRLEAERTLHKKTKNLIVAATGTGKTVVAALDYKRLGGTLLFVAHRGEILTQSLHTFRAVLRQGDFGDLWGFDHTPTQFTHLFASVQTLANIDLEKLDPKTFDVIIIDEFHHAAAPTYQRLLDHFQPGILVGLTATPERADGQPVLDRFDHRIAAELRLWDAIERGTLSPFQYFGVHDNTDLTTIPWTRRYDPKSLENVYTGNEARARLILQAVQDRVADPRAMRALGFCVSVAHARHMAEQFSTAGIPSTTVTGETPPETRQAAIHDLRARRINAIFSVDVFNEGVDVPEVDTVLMLRPTESATIFLQQLGRGLRLTREKDCLTVLDFIGFAHKSFRFALRFQKLISATRAEVERHIDQDFPLLPSGCSIHLDRIAKRIVLDNIKQSLQAGARRLLDELQPLPRDVRLQEYLERADMSPEDLYRHTSWTALRRRAGFPTPPAGPDDERLLRALARLLHVDDPDRLQRYATPRAPDAMLHFALWGTRDAPRTLDDSLTRLRQHPAVLDELRQLMAVLEDRADHLTHPHGTLRVHATYTRDEILAALGSLTPERPNPIREGVLALPDGNDAFFVTIEKSERHYSPSTMYRDFAISPTLFHWESQSVTRADSPTGRRYQRHGAHTHALLFVRKTRKDARGVTSPYLFLGPAAYVRHEGERPMAITWRLLHAIPAAFYRHFRLAA